MRSIFAICNGRLSAPGQSRGLAPLIIIDGGGAPEMTTNRLSTIGLRSSKNFQIKFRGLEHEAHELGRALELQYTHGFPLTPKGHPQLTHGFHPYPAGVSPSP